MQVASSQSNIIVLLFAASDGFLFHSGRSETGDWCSEQLEVDDDERRRLVNNRIDPALVNTVLEFIYQDEYQDSVPPMLRPTAGLGQIGQDGQQVGTL